MASRRISEDEDQGVTVILPTEDDDSSPDRTMFLIADETIREAEEQLRLDRAEGFREPAPAHESRFPSTTWLLRGQRLCVECLAIYAFESQARCCACGGTVCAGCVIDIAEIGAVLCPTCLRSNAEEA